MLVPFVLSVIAGSVDVIGFLGLDGLFIAHITGSEVTANTSRLKLSARRRPLRSASHPSGGAPTAPPAEINPSKSES